MDHTDNIPLEEHPLQNPSIVVENTDTEERTVYEIETTRDKRQSNSCIPAELENDKSHAKGFYNTFSTQEVVDLDVQGQLPTWLLGEHYTVGPGVYDVKYSRKMEIEGVLQSCTFTFTLGHWFDAIPLVNRFDMNGERNTVTYRHNLPNKRLVEKIRDHHGFAPGYPAGLFKTNPNQTMLIKFLNKGKKPKADRVPCGQRIITQLPGVDGRLFCQNFANHIEELDPFDLKAKRIQTWDEVNPAFKGYSASPNGHYDPETGEYINFTMEIGYRSTSYHFFAITDQEPKGHIITSIWNAPTGWVNNFAVTPHYIVMVIHPMLANTSAVKFAWNESILDSFNFYPSEPTLFYVISRKEKAVIACYRAPASFSFSQANAHEDVHGNILIDMVCYNDDAISMQLSTENLRSPETMDPLSMAHLRRYTLTHPQHEAHKVYVANNSYIPSVINITSRIGTVYNYVTGNMNKPDNAVGSSGWHAWMPVVAHQQLVEGFLELPTINPNCNMKKYTFVYGVGFSTDNAPQKGQLWDTIVKVNVDNKTIVASWHQDNCYPSEAQFIPQPNQTGTDKVGEDDGVLISVVMDSARSTSFLLILDAQHLNELARVELNKLVPLSFARGAYRQRLT
ncbi:carotenoid oxygenase [Pilobolus umbonatus]|nr:carotenoid oxygenase [Pilobolus umbonatus]